MKSAGAVAACRSCLREALIDSVSKTGGHLASNLGAVELSIALARVFDTRRGQDSYGTLDHQAYRTQDADGPMGCHEDRLRLHGGISGFPKRF